MVKVEIVISEDMECEQSVVRCFIQEFKNATQNEYLIARTLAHRTYKFVKDRSVEDLVKPYLEKKDEQANNKN